MQMLEQLFLSHQDTSLCYLISLRSYMIIHLRISWNYSFPCRDNCRANEQLLSSHQDYFSLLLAWVLLSSCWVLVELFVFQWSRAIIMTSRYIFFFSETWDVENCSGFLVEMFPFQWTRARDHVDRIQFRDRAIWSGFVHASESVHVTESDKYMLQNMEGIELGGLHTYLIRGFVDVSL